MRARLAELPAPDVLHVNDWHVGLGPLMLRLLSSWDGLFANTRSVLTVHNLGYQGVFGVDATAQEPPVRCHHDRIVVDRIEDVPGESLDGLGG